MGAALFAVQGPGSPSLLDPLGVCSACGCGDAAEWAACGDEDTSGSSSRSCPGRGAEVRRAGGGRRRRPAGAAASRPSERLARRIEELTLDLFRLHDLNGNGLLEEQELVQLNERIAVLHHGTAANTREVRSKYRDLFRAKLDPHGRPVPFEKFRRYAVEFLDGLDPDPEAQEMIMEQFVAEAHSGRKAMDLWSDQFVAEPEPQQGRKVVDLLSGLPPPPPPPPAPAAPRYQVGGAGSSSGAVVERLAAPMAAPRAATFPPAAADLLDLDHRPSADARAGAAKDSSDAPLTESRERCEWPLLQADDAQGRAAAPPGGAPVGMVPRAVGGAASAPAPMALPATALAALQAQNLGGGRLRSTLV